MGHIIKIMILLISGISYLHAQENYIFQGGDGSGWSADHSIASVSYPYNGGNGQGFTFDISDAPSSTHFEGGVSDGTDSDMYAASHYVFDGGHSAGFGVGLYLNDHFLYQGGTDDGFASLLYRVPFIWTGTIGTSWTVSGNWNYNLIPGIFRPVIIPDGVPNWPFVNAGLFAIGDTPNGSNYRCASLWIQEGAFLQTRINNRIENYGLITIDGEMRVKKFTVDAFKNFEEGTVIINSGGELVIKP